MEAPVSRESESSSVFLSPEHDIGYFSNCQGNKSGRVEENNAYVKLLHQQSHIPLQSHQRPKKIQHSKSVVNNLAVWFGVEERYRDDEKWKEHIRRRRVHNRLVGQYKPPKEGYDDVFDSSSMQRSPGTAMMNYRPQNTIIDPYSKHCSKQLVNRQISKISTSSSSKRATRTIVPVKLEPKESVLRMAYHGFRNAITPTVKDNMSWPKCRSITLHQIRREAGQGDEQSNGEEAYLDDVFFNERTIPANNYSQNNSFENFSTLDSAFTYNESVHQGGENSFVAMSKIHPSVLENVSGRSGRQIGVGFVGDFFTEAEYRKSRIDSTITKQMDHLEDHRPYFTCWVTFVQVVCFIFAIFAYDMAPFGISMTTVSQEVLMPNLAIEESSYSEENNVWLGLRQADLIHMGAKYAGCMRVDEKIRRYILKDREYERETSCCIRLDGSGCYQASEDNCSFPLGRHVAMSSLTNWKTWRNGTGPFGRSSGSVCHQDPRFCLKPLTPLKQHNWPDDITKWPVCKESYAISDLPHEDTDHMTCDITGRPCCIGIRGQCIITTREDCDFRRGFYHQNTSLCSQVACLEEVCGMIPFLDSETPDQLYRLFISLFIHAGVVHLLVTVIFQLTVMRDLEKLAGSTRIGIIYIFSGIAGNLTSAIFLPHIVEAGPSGSQFGLLACLFVEVIQNWYILKRPLVAIMKLSSVIIFLFLLGLMPMVDNFAHLGGFTFGFLLSFTFLPYITFNIEDQRAKTRMVVTCIVVSLLLLGLLFLLFYVVPINNCSFCHYINCVPITSSFCRNMELNTEN